MKTKATAEHRRERVRGNAIACYITGLSALFGIMAAGLSPALVTPAHAALEQPGSASTSSAYYEDARALVDRGELKAAVIQLKNALGKDPDHLAARLLLGEVYTKLGFALAAVDAFETAAALGADDSLVVVPLFRAHLLSRNYKKILADIDINARPRSIRADLLIIRGHARLELGNYADAEKDFGEAAALSPRDAAPLVGEALVHFNRGEPEDAEAVIEQAIEREPDDASAWFVRGEIKRARTINAGAIEDYTHALAINPRHYKARLARAALGIDSRNFEDAKSDLDFLEELYGDDPQVTYFNALILLQEGKWQGAGEALDTALAFAESQAANRGTENPQNTLLAGVVRLLKGDQEQAYRLLSDHVDLVPDDPAGRMVLGRVLIMMDEPARALNVLAPVRRFTPQSPELYALMGVAHMRLGDYAEATDHLDQAIARASDTVPFQMEVARMKIKGGKEAGARERLVEILKLEPGSIEANYILAYLEINNGNYPAARNYARQMMQAAPQNPTGANLDGIILLSQGHIPQATVAFEKARELSPDFFSASHNLAQLDLARGQLDRARAEYEGLLQRNVKDIRPMIELAKIAKYQGNWLEAIERLEKIRGLRPDAWQIWMELTDLYLRVGDETRSSSVVEQLVRLAPDDIGVVVALGRAELAVGAKDDARRTFGRAAVYAKDDPGALREIAKYMVLAGGLNEAENALKSGIRLAPNDIESHAALIALYANQDRFVDAFAHAEHVRTTWPKDPLGSMLIGDIHMRKGDWRAALKAYNRAGKQGETAALALRTYRAEIALHQDAENQRAAMNRLRDFSTRHPDNKAIEQALASAMGRVGDYDMAGDLFRKLLAQDPENVVVLNNLALLYIATGDPRAVEVARRAYALGPEEAAVLDTLGWALTRAGQPGEALGLLREASVRASGIPEIHYHLAVTLNDLDRPREALKEVTLAMKSEGWFDGRKDAEALARLLGEH